MAKKKSKAEKVETPEVEAPETQVVEEEIVVAADSEEGELSLEDQVEQLQAELEIAKEDRLRAIADQENARRRTQREIENSRKYACEPLARNLLAVIDNLNRALEAVPAEKAETDTDLKNLRVGVEMTAKEFEQAFAKVGIEKISPIDEPFDPNLHQAMFEVPDPDSEPGIVKNVVAHGYKLHDRLLRAAMVGVSKKA